MELGVPDPVPTLNAPAISYQLQQCFWGSPQAGVAPRGAPVEPIQMGRPEWFAVTVTGGRQLHDPAGTAPGFTDVCWCFLCPQSPGDVAPVADLLIPCHKRDRALSMELAGNLAMERFLVGLFLRRSPWLQR